ncbi:hypothetical protein R3P38DRAFT_2811591 [Favolaschia claudopus]|uniref:Uncharacterized protein n=1 Tax=Favolaschia claudopus TaxID=2862362 RepID=A0AAV9Z9A3_9AGAR
MSRKIMDITTPDMSGALGELKEALTRSHTASPIDLGWMDSSPSRTSDNSDEEDIYIYKVMSRGRVAERFERHLILSSMTDIEIKLSSSLSGSTGFLYGSYDRQLGRVRTVDPADRCQWARNCQQDICWRKPTENDYSVVGRVPAAARYCIQVQHYLLRGYP